MKSEEYWAHLKFSQAEMEIDFVAPFVSDLSFN